MDKSRIILSVGRLSCVHISNEDTPAVSHFEIANANGGFLSDYIKKFAMVDEATGNARTYLIYDNLTEELVAYFSLKSGFVSTNETNILFRRVFDTEPGVELSNFAVNGVYKRNHPSLKGIGIEIFRSFILPIISEAAEKVGIRIVYIFALPYRRLIEYYQDMGFKRLNKVQERTMHTRIKPRYDKGCIFMYQVL
jgi:hypothetical protein